MSVTIYNEDCLEGMNRIPNASIDMILCDLPYGTTQNAWDKALPLDRLWEQYKRVIKEHGVICLFAQIPFSIQLGASNLPWLRYEWIIQKTMATGFLNANRMPLKAHEQLLVFYKHLPKYHPQKFISKRGAYRRGGVEPHQTTAHITPKGNAYMVPNAFPMMSCWYPMPAEGN